MRTVTVGRTATLMDVLQESWGLSRTRVKRLVRGKMVSVSGRVARDPMMQVNVGDEIALPEEIQMIEGPTEQPTGLPTGLAIEYEDENVIILRKDAGFSVLREHRPFASALAFLSSPPADTAILRHVSAGGGTPCLLSLLPKKVGGLTALVRSQQAWARCESLLAENVCRIVRMRFRCMLIRSPADIPNDFIVEKPFDGEPARTRVVVVARTPSITQGELVTVDMYPLEGGGTRISRNLEHASQVIDHAPGVILGLASAGPGFAHAKGVYLSLCAMTLLPPLVDEEHTVEIAEPTKFEAMRERELRAWSKRELERDMLAEQLGSPNAVLFDKLRLRVSPDVLRPRKGSEALVTACAAFQPTRLLDVGTGCGCLALAVLNRVPGCRAIAIDISEAALQVAHDNAMANSLSYRCVFKRGDLGALEESVLSGSAFDVIVCNPPYLDSARANEYHMEDPHEAIFADEGGLGAHRRLLESIERGGDRVLVRGGALVLEVNNRQASAVCALAQRVAPSLCFRRVDKDAFGFDRVLVFEREGAV